MFTWCEKILVVVNTNFVGVNKILLVWNNFTRCEFLFSHHMKKV
jgi:hypothetical protein